MNVILSWILGAAIFLLFLAVFLWSAIRLRRPIKMINREPAPYLEEFSAEITFPGPVAETKPVAKPDMPEIPWHYGLDRLVLMVRDPDWIFAYWEITATKQEEFNRQYGPHAWETTKPVLRVYDVTGIKSFSGTNANNYLDISISDTIESWHIEVGRPESSFCVDLGRIFPDGRFVTLLRSNIVHTPSVSVSNLLDEEWMWIDGIYKTITHLHQGSSPMMTEQTNLEMSMVPISISSPGFNDQR